MSGLVVLRRLAFDIVCPKGTAESSFADTPLAGKILHKRGNSLKLTKHNGCIGKLWYQKVIASNGTDLEERDTRIIDETRKVPQTHEMEWCCGTFYDIMIPNKKKNQ